jgi:diguanylate cyclase (GGDEF)-like protein/PAS domain S-box-containing protein
MTGALVQAKLRFALDEHWRVLSVDDGIESLLGFSAGDFLRSAVNLRDRIHADDSDIANLLFSPPLEDKSGTFNFRLRHADGLIRCVRGEYRKTPAGDGAPATLELLLQDAKSLWKNPDSGPVSANFRALMENTDDFIFFKDRNHVFTAASRNLIKPSGSKGEHGSLLGLTDYDIFPEGYADIYYRLEKQVFGGVPVAGEVHEAPKLDGQLIWQNNRKYPIKNEQGEIVGLFGVVRDITEQMKAQQALADAERKYRIIFDGAVEGMFRTTMDGRVVIANPAAVTILGYDSEEDALGSITDMGRDVWLDLGGRARYLQMLMDAKDHAILGYECRFKRKDGTSIWISLNGRLVFGDDSQTAYHDGFFIDITERKETEESLRASEELLKEAQRIAGLGSYVTDLRGGVWTSSEVLDQLFGINKDYDRSVEGWTALVHPDDRAPIVAYFTEAILGAGKPFDMEFRILRQTDSAVRWVHGLGWLELDANGQPAKMHGTIQDITERKLTEAALRESEESLKESQRIAGLGSYVHDIATGRWTSSDIQDQLFGIDKAYERTVEGWVALIHPDDREMMVSYFANEVLGKGTPFDKVYRIVRPSDSAVRWLHGLGRLDYDAAGRPVKMHGTIRDITERRQAVDALRESKELLQLFITHAPAGLAMLDREMRFLAASRRWLEMHSVADQELVGHSEYEIFPEIPESWREEHRRALAGESFPVHERLLERLNGTTQWVRREIIPWRKGDGSIGGIILFSEDITVQKENEERLRLAASVFTNAGEGILITDAHSNILEVNEMFTRITGYTREEVLGKNPRMLKSGLQSEEFYANMWRSLMEEGQWSGEVWNRTKSGEIYAETLTISSVRDATGHVVQYVALFSDLTQIKEHERQLEHVSHYDVLTSLPNRTLLADRLRQAMTLPSQQSRLLAVAYLDLDGFKGVNDQHGHGAGDRLLTALAFNMKCALRKGDTLARLGGDEFVAVILDLNDAEASIPVLNRLLEAAAESVQVGEMCLRLTASVGVAFYPQKDEVDADSLLRQADQAMYQAKLAGGNRYHIFDPDNDQLVRGRHENLEHIRHALAAHEFVLYYQPKVNMRTGKVVGAEALLRWQHPERGLLPPGMFLPMIEEHPLAVELGEWVIDTALTQIESWSAGGLQIPVSVNVGALQLQQPNFVDRLSNLLAAHPTVKPFNLELEVLETSALQDVAQTSQVLNACHEIGVSFALDDFGTGYSSLTYLKRLPASMLKIDQSFVSDMLDDPENLNILEGVLGLAAAFHRQVIAEGVETVEHGLMLLQLGCELAQGYGIARPMPARDLPGWVSAWQPDPRWAEVPPVHNGNRVLLYACVEHRAWIAAFEAFLQGKRHTPPSLDYHRCRLGIWLDAEKQAGRDKQPAYLSVESVHREFHELATDIFSSLAAGRNSEGLGHLGDLHHLRDALFGRLELLRQQS